MARPVTLFTGQWADLPSDELAASASDWGYDGLELACWGDHFDVAAALADSDYVKVEWEDSGMAREWGAAEAVGFVRKTDFAPAAQAFDAAMQRSSDD